MNKKTIHIALCADENYSMYLGVCLTSIFSNNKEDSIKVHILTQGFSKKSKALLDKTAENFGQSLIYYNVDDTLFNGYPITPWFPKSIYFRYLLPQILPTTLEKIIYLDSDIIVLGSLRSLWEENITEFPIGAVEDAWGDLIHMRNRIEVYDGGYFNSGVLLLNLSLWRKYDYFKQLANYIHDNPDKCLYPDQDALNVIFHHSVKWLSFKYNFQMILCEPPNKYYLKKSYENDIKSSFANIIILHYATYDLKPWYAAAKHPLIFIWRHYKENSLWKNYPLIHREGIIKRLLKRALKKGIYSKQYVINPDLSNILNILKKQFQ